MKLRMSFQMQLFRRLSSEARVGGRVTTTSSLFIPSRKLPESKQATLHSHKLMLRAGLLRRSSPGVYHLLPLGLRAFEKLVSLIDREMQAIGGAKMAMPVLTSAELWRTSGRWEAVGPELFRLKDQHDTDYCLGPTHEELVTELVGQELYSYKQLPLRLYQLDRKFRDEIRPRGGLLRGREFWMKDMYSFDMNEEKAGETYSDVCSAYERIFRRLNLPVVKVKADPGNIGGSLSHEYHVISAAGEDTIVTCESCGEGSSMEVLEGERDLATLPECPQGGEGCKLKERRAIEVAHSFFLGTKYSDVFQASFVDQNNKKWLCQMGCYGIGVSRVLQTVIEHSCSHHQELPLERVVWPEAIAPYSVCIAPLTVAKDPSECPLVTEAMELYNVLQRICPGDVILEDRWYLSVGRRLRDLEIIGYPTVVIVGEKVPEGYYELQIQSAKGREIQILDKNSLVQFFETSYSATHQ